MVLRGAVLGDSFSAEHTTQWLLVDFHSSVARRLET